MSTEQNFTFQLGETWEIDFALNDGAGDDLNLDGATVAFVLHLGKDQKLLLTTEGADIDVSSPESGVGTVVVPPADQAELKPETYLYEIRAILADERVTVQAFGRILVGASLLSWPAAST